MTFGLEEDDTPPPALVAQLKLWYAPPFLDGEQVLKLLRTWVDLHGRVHLAHFLLVIRSDHFMAHLRQVDSALEMRIRQNLLALSTHTTARGWCVGRSVDPDGYPTVPWCVLLRGAAEVLVTEGRHNVIWRGKRPLDVTLERWS